MSWGYGQYLRYPKDDSHESQHTTCAPTKGWDNHTEEAAALQVPLSVAGRGLGNIHPKFFESETWARHLGDPMDTCQYAKFVDAMMNRIRFGESDPVEIRSFVNLIATDSNWRFMEVALPRIPELMEDHLHDQKHFQLALLYQQLRQRVNKRSVQESPFPKQPEVWTYECGLKPAEKDLIRGAMFGPRTMATEPVESNSMRRLFSTFITHGFPQAALDEHVAVAKAKGTDIHRDHQGLPWDIRLPLGYSEETQSSQKTCLRPADYFFTPGGSRLSSGSAWPGGPASSSKENSSSVAENNSETNDSPSPNLLTQSKSDGADDPGQTLPKHISSHRNFPEIQISDQPGGFMVQQAEPQAHSQVPKNVPAAFLRTQTDKDIFRAIHHAAGPLVSLDYFESLPPQPPPPAKLSSEEDRPENPLPAAPASCHAVPKEMTRNESAPVDNAITVICGGFAKPKLAVRPFQKSNPLMHPKDPYVTGWMNGKLVVL